MLKYLVPAIALLVAAPVASAGVESTGSYLQTDFEVAGVSLGMQPNAAFMALEERGYKMSPEEDNDGTERGPSFDEMVQIAAGEIKKSVAKDSWKSALFTKGSDQAVEIRFKPLPTGTAVSSVVYGSYAASMSWERFQDAVTSKYGKPRHADKRLMRWSNMPLKGSQVNIAEGAISLEAYDGGNANGLQGSRQEKVTLTLFRGKVSLADVKKIAKEWTPEPKTDF